MAITQSGVFTKLILYRYKNPKNNKYIGEKKTSRITDRNYKLVKLQIKKSYIRTVLVKMAMPDLNFSREIHV